MQKNSLWSTWDIRHAERLQLGSNRTDPSKEHWKQPAIMRIRPVMEFPGTCASTRNSSKHFSVRFIQSLVSGDSLQNIKTSWDPAIPSIHIFGHGHRSHLNIGKCKMQVHFVWNHFCLKIPQWETSSKYNISIVTDQLQMICCDHSWRQEKEGNHRYKTPPKVAGNREKSENLGRQPSRGQFLCPDKCRRKSADSWAPQPWGWPVSPPPWLARPRFHARTNAAISGLITGGWIRSHPQKYKNMKCKIQKKKYMWYVWTNGTISGLITGRQIKAIHKNMKHTKETQKLPAPIMGYLKSFRYLGYLGQLMFCLFGGKLCHFKTHDQLPKVFNARTEREEILRRKNLRNH